MGRIARLVVPRLPHLVAQHGVRSVKVFEHDRDRELYLAHMREQCERFGVRVLAWCLMPRQVYLVCVPAREESLAVGVGEAHRRYTRARNVREGVRGYLFEGRFSSCVLDEQHLLSSVRYVELKPVAAGIARRPESYAWSSARSHPDRRRKDPLILGRDRGLMGLVEDWSTFLADGVDESAARRIELALSTGRPLGSEAFVRRLEERTGRRLRPRKRGPRKRNKRAK